MHFLALDGREPIGTVRLVYPPVAEKYKLGRLAVRKAGRGRGVARLLVAELENAAGERGAERIFAGSQVPVRPFYERCGYISTGHEYLDEGQSHIMMVKELTVIR
jgi:predicted GNAT family N-acyltransferase